MSRAVVVGRYTHECDNSFARLMISFNCFSRVELSSLMTLNLINLKHSTNFAKNYG